MACKGCQAMYANASCVQINGTLSEELGVEEWLIRVVQALYTNARSCVQINGTLSEELGVEEWLIRVVHALYTNARSCVQINGTLSEVKVGVFIKDQCSVLYCSL